ncbi:MAG: citrate/2-methylcitrate synthase [Rubrobacteraceae bacterium]
MEEKRYLTAREAAEALGVSLPTLYAYVSRGLVRSEATGGGRRDRRYHAEDVRRLQERKEYRRDPDRVVEDALRWGAPVLESGITLVSGGHLYYRGWDALELARNRSIEQVAALIWAGDLREAVPESFFRELDVPNLLSAASPAMRHLTILETFQALLPLAAADDVAAYDLRPRAVARAGARILLLMAGVLAREAGIEGVANTLCRGWGLDETRDGRLLDAALILCADHELPVSTFAVRCVASSGATPYAAVIAGLSAAQGVKHGGQIGLVQNLLRDAEASGDARKVLAERLRRGETIPGFGHSLYPEGDPRGAELLRLAGAAYPDSPAVDLSGSVAAQSLEILEEHPTVDFGLATLSRVLGLPAEGALALFVVGRTVGWIGHAIEQYGTDGLIRPRARYVGEQPPNAGR